jgi:hypothetical protein
MRHIEIFQGIRVASTEQGKATTNQFKNISVQEYLAKLCSPSVGCKDGGHFLRASLIVDDSGMCLSRNDANSASLARLLIVDADKSFNSVGELNDESAPCPYVVHRILREKNIWHIIYGSFSYYSSEKFKCRYRIIFFTNKPYNKGQLVPTVESLNNLININLHNSFLVNVIENARWSQPWYYPRKPINCAVDDLYLEHLGGDLVDVIEPEVLPTIDRVIISPNAARISSANLKHDSEIHAITAFNIQFPLRDLLVYYGYKKLYKADNFEKWLSPNSTSGVAGITYWENQNKFYSHHNDRFNDKNAHDSFDLMMVMEGLTFREAVKKAARDAIAPDGTSVDTWNKSLPIRNRARTAR